MNSLQFIVIPLNSWDFLGMQELDELAAAAPSMKLLRPTRGRRGRRIPASIRNLRRLAGGGRGIPTNCYEFAMNSYELQRGY